MRTQRQSMRTCCRHKLKDNMDSNSQFLAQAVCLLFLIPIDHCCDERRLAEFIHCALLASAAGSCHGLCKPSRQAMELDGLTWRAISTNMDVRTLSNLTRTCTSLAAHRIPMQVSTLPCYCITFQVHWTATEQIMNSYGTKLATMFTQSYTQQGSRIEYS